MIDSNLSWKHLSGYICHEVSKSIEIVAKLRHHFSRRLLFNIYHTLIAPFINYGICAWGSRVQVYQKRLLVLLQKRDFRLFFLVSLENMQFSFLPKQNVFLCPFRFLNM